MTRAGRILLVDDDPAMRDTVSEVLRLGQHRVETAGLGREGLDRLATQPFDVAVVDIRLPDVSGLGLLSAIKSAAPETEVIVITGNASLPTAIEAINGGAFGYLQKPFEPEQLVAAINRALEKQALVRALREGEERFRLMVENVVDYAIVMLDPEGRVVTWNAGADRITGYRTEEIIGAPVSAFYTREAVETGLPDQALREAAATGRYTAEGWRVRKDGSRFWANVVVTALRDDLGRLRGFAKVTRDMTERKATEQALQEREATFRLLFAANPHPMWVYDLETLAFLEVNDAATAEYGYTRDEFLRMRITDIRPPDEAPPRQEPRAGRHAPLTLEGEGRHMLKDGRVLDVQVGSHTLEFGGRRAALVVAQDITEGKRAREITQAFAEIGRELAETLDLPEVARRISAAVLRLLRVSHARVFQRDPAGGTLVCIGATGGRAPETWLGRSLPPGAGIAGRAIEERHPVAWSDIMDRDVGLPPWAVEEVRAEGLGAAAGASLTAHGEILGAIVVADRVGRAFPDDDLGLLAAFADRAAVAVKNAQLFEQVRAGRERLQMVSRRLVDAQEAERRHIARELHDEIGQGLTGLKLTLQMGARASGDAPRTGLEEAEALVSELMARVRQLSLDLRPPMLDDLGLLPALLWHLERYTTQTRVRVRCQHTGLDRRLRADVETAAYRLVQEALTNVARHARVAEVDVRVSAGPDVLSLLIEDRGAGFDVAAATAAGATGGLEGMRERAMLLGGRLTIESAPGKGTRVAADLPLGDRIERRTGPRK